MYTTIDSINYFPSSSSSSMFEFGLYDGSTGFDQVPSWAEDVPVLVTGPYSIAYSVTPSTGMSGCGWMATSVEDGAGGHGGAKNTAKQPPRPLYLPPTTATIPIASPSSYTFVPMSISSADHPAKRSAAEDLEHCTAGRASQTKKQRVYVEEVVDEDPLQHADRHIVDAVEIKLEPPVDVLIPSDPCTTSAVTTAPLSQPPPPPPRSPSPPRFLQSRPAIPSPLCNCSPSHCSSSACSPADMPSTPPPAPRRRRSNEIALLKFALDPWLRLSRSMANPNSFPAGCKSSPNPYNPATYPSAGNLRELRRWNAAPSSSDWDISFGFQTTPNVGLGFGGLESVSWNLVGA